MTTIATTVGYLATEVKFDYFVHLQPNKRHIYIVEIDSRKDVNNCGKYDVINNRIK